MVAVHTDPSSNQAIAAQLSTIADLLQRRGASEYRVTAYQRAADTLQTLSVNVQEIYRRDGLKGLIALPTIGLSIAHLIAQYLQTQQMPLLEKLQGRVSHPAANQRSFGDQVQLRLWDESSDAARVPVEELLSVDEEFRTANIDGEARLAESSETSISPWRTQRGERHYTARYSTSPRARQLKATGDWVVITCDDIRAGGSWTVITSHQGRLHGCRTVRGRESECYQHYRAAAKEAVQQHPLRMK